MKLTSCSRTNSFIHYKFSVPTYSVTPYSQCMNILCMHLLFFFHGSSPCMSILCVRLFSAHTSTPWAPILQAHLFSVCICYLLSIHIVFTHGFSVCTFSPWHISSAGIYSPHSPILSSHLFTHLFSTFTHLFSMKKILRMM